MTPSAGTSRKSRLQHHRQVLAAAKDATPEERRALLETARRETRDRRLARPLPRWMATRTSRRTLAGLAAIPFACGAASAYLPAESPVTYGVQMVGAIAVLAGLGLLRRATKELSEIPDSDLDERELDDRNQALKGAYVALLILLGTAVVLTIADGLVLSTVDWKPLVFGTFGSAVLLPSAAIAWDYRELDDEG
ncbi:hypothetical protein [Amycolatopsis taiwanensis]|uniref:Uncharacterized protein n=1 Tax=Amycolatopsis taiwanensis TaxID=342230 RepID=A0A9W6VFV7_9PSEU|nr:hypothetical protein [Amycolatopsis taiwanensis]GLY64881.1 hypothetical protein Atai01_15000 [Amycolatopsis taiwanensis]